MTRSGGRGANRGRGRGRDEFGRQGYPKFSNNQGAPVIPGNLRGAPTPPDWRGRGRGGAPVGEPRGRGTPRFTGQPCLNLTPSASLFGIAPRTCWSCGDPTHRVGGDACYYKASALQQQSCSACHMGGHRRAAAPAGGGTGGRWHWRHRRGRRHRRMVAPRMAAPSKAAPGEAAR